MSEGAPREAVDAPETDEAGQGLPSLWRVLAAPVALALSVLALVFGIMIGVGLEDEEAATPTTPTETLPTGYAEGEKIFASQGCGGCHTLEAAGATGTTGPSLDVTTLTEPEIAAVVANGRGTGMPAFSGSLSDEEIDTVAVYVATASGGSP